MAGTFTKQKRYRTDGRGLVTSHAAQWQKDRKHTMTSPPWELIGSSFNLLRPSEFTLLVFYYLYILCLPYVKKYKRFIESHGFVKFCGHYHDHNKTHLCIDTFLDLLQQPIIIKEGNKKRNCAV